MLLLMRRKKLVAMKRAQGRTFPGGCLLRFEQVYEPVANSIVLSTLVALIPIVVLFVMLAIFSVPAQWSSLASLAAAFVIVVAVYGMPLGLALNATI
jgi:hypothetical protein